MFYLIVMIPRGICVDLETTITAKISDAIRGPGFKRFETRIIEIGACHWKDSSMRFMRLVNPITVPLASGPELMRYLHEMHQKPKPTLNFWSTVLYKRKSLDRDMFLTEEDPAVWLARSPERRAEDFVRWFNGAHGPDFVTETEALRDLVKWTGSNPWLAHNGNSFDFKVLAGCSERTGVPIPKTIEFHDTLKLFRKYIPGHKSYSQPKLYEAIFNEKYNAHVAIDDSLALSRLCNYCNSSKNSSMALKNFKTTPSKNSIVPFKILKNPSKNSSMALKKFKETPSKIISTAVTQRAMNLTFPKLKKSNKKIPTKKINHIMDLNGIGPKSCAVLASNGVISLVGLKEQYEIGKSQWLKDILPFGANWRKVEQSIKSLN